MRESRTYGSVRGARDETRVPTASDLFVPMFVVASAHVGLWHDLDESQCSDSPLLVEADIGVLRS